MKKFLRPSRLWGVPGGPESDWIRPHVLWLPQDHPHVLNHFRRLRALVDQYPDVLTPIADVNLHMTIQSISQRTPADGHVDEHLLAAAAEAIQDELSDIAPFDIAIGPPRAAGCAAVLDVLPQEATAELNNRVRVGALAAGMMLPPTEQHFWGHMSCGYGVQDPDTAELAARSDEFASAIGTVAWPGAGVTATLSSVWLGWQRQDPQRNTYTFQRVHELPLAAR